jgi:hypothetical protein
MLIKTLDVPAAGTWARDCILISLSYTDELKISYQKEDDTLWELQGQGVIAFNLASEEFSLAPFLLNLPVEGAFFEMLDSPLLAELELKFSKKLNGYKHYIFKFYDETVEVILQKVDFFSIANLGNS